MKLTVLMDNNTFIDRYLLGEPGLSYLIEDAQIKILFDAGYSDAFLKNATRLSVDLLDIEYVVLSHGHEDHTGGLAPLIRLHSEAVGEGRATRKPTLVAHPLVLSSRVHDERGEIGLRLSREELSTHFDVKLSQEPMDLTARLVFLGEIPRHTSFEANRPLGRILTDGAEQADFVMDDSAVVYKSSGGLVIITGCSHAGICNIVERAKAVCGDHRVVDIIGGLHLLAPSADHLEGTLRYLGAVQPRAVHAGHCTDLKSKNALSRVVDLQEVGVGLILEY